MGRTKKVYDNLDEMLEEIKHKLNNGKQLGRIIPRSCSALKLIEEATSFLNEYYKNIRGSIRPIDRIFCLLNNIISLPDIPICKHCNKNYVLFLRDGKLGFSEVCSQSCGVVYGGTKNGDPEISKKAAKIRKQTVKEKYGVDHISQLDEIKEKKKETAINNYGSLKAAYIDTSSKVIKKKYKVDNISQLNETKEKKKETSRKKYGTDYPWQSQKGKEEQKLGVTRKYNVNNISQLDETKEKKKETCLKHYGVDNYSKSLKFIESMMRENNPNWRGGISFGDYCDIWNSQEFKNMIIERDSKKCLNPTCNKKNENDIVIHHIDYNKKNCHPSNLITICRSCNTTANFNRSWHKSWYKAIILKRYGERGI